MEIKNLGKALGGLVMLAAVWWASYLWASTQGATQRIGQLEADVRVLKVDIQGQLARMADEQARMREELARMREDMNARQRSGR